MSGTNTTPRRVLVISPHTDDELFGLGGTLLKLKASSPDTSIKLVVMSCSTRYLSHLGRNITADEQWCEFSECAKHLSTEPPGRYILDDRLELEPCYRIVRWLDELVQDYKPTTVFIPEPSYHQEHQLVYKACIAACRPTFGEKSIRDVYLYEIPTSCWSGPDGIFKPNVYVDITTTIDEKVRLFKETYRLQYTTDKRNKLGENGIVSHAQYRGTEAGQLYAESFMLIRSTGVL